MQRIESDADIERALDDLVSIDPRLVIVREQAGPVGLRRNPADFASLASVIVAQQISRASAEAILGRMVQLIDPFTPRQLLIAGEAALIEAGLSRAKQRTFFAVAEAVERDGLDLASLADQPAEQAIETLVRFPGIGPWTAEVYLLTAAGHSDIFPSGDVALQAAVGQALLLEKRPDSRQLAALAEIWQPWRTVAACLFWAYYRKMKGRDGFPLIQRQQ